MHVQEGVPVRSCDGVEADVVAAGPPRAGLAIKNPPKITLLKQTLKMFSFGFFSFFIFYENNTNFSL
jgi:hypothetical protein